MLNRTLAPPIKNATDFKFELPALEHFTLRNGVDLYTLNGGIEEVVQLEWVFFAGNSYEPSDLVAAATNFLLRNGTDKKTAFEINEHFEYHGSYLNRNCFHETSNITLHALTKALPELLPVVAELINNSIFPEQELDIFRQNSKQQLSVNLKKPDFIANREIDVLLYGPKHPYAKYSTMEGFDALQRDQLGLFYDQFYKHGRCMIFAAGKLPLPFIQWMDNAFGSLPLKPIKPLPEPSFLLPTPKQNRITLINDEAGVQSAIRLARHFPNRHHPDFMDVQFLNTVYGGYFGSRLMANIREEKGYTYGVYSFLQNHILQSAWVISTEAGRQVTDETILEMHREMIRLQQEPIDEEELQLVRNYILGSVLGDLDGPFQVINRWKGYLLHGCDADYFSRAIDRIKTVDAKRLQELAQQYLQPESFLELVVV